VGWAGDRVIVSGPFDGATNEVRIAVAGGENH